MKWRENGQDSNATPERRINCLMIASLAARDAARTQSLWAVNRVTACNLGHLQAGGRLLAESGECNI
jgi:hypothetical protein